MTDQNTENNIEQNPETVSDTTVVADAVAPVAAAPSRGRDFRKNKRPASNKGRRERVKPEFDQKILDIRRTARMTSGGRRFNFSVAVVIGDRKGRLGVGTGKAGDTSLAMEKAYKNAKKNFVTIPTTKSLSIPHEVTAKYASARVKIMPAPNRGIIAGSAVRDCIQLAGLHDINAKIISPSKNKLNIARATVLALSSFKKILIKKAEKAAK